MAMCKVSTSVHFLTASVGIGGKTAAKAHWTPNTDVYTTENGLVIKVDLAGMRSENLEITVEGHRLTIRGTRPDGCRAPKCSFVAMEINYGPIETMLEVPAGYELAQAKAAYLNGFLRIDVPRVQPAQKNTKLTVSTGDHSIL
jgi:HSP20 family protein